MKAWEDLQFHDDYMFKLVMRDKTICKGTIERILRFPVGDIHYVNYEQTFELGFDSKSVRMDVYVANSNEVVDLEMQMWNPGAKHLVKRSRYYQAVLDADCLCRADSYTDLRRSYVIFICPFDIFGEGRHRSKIFASKTKICHLTMNVPSYSLTPSVRRTIYPPTCGR